MFRKFICWLTRGEATCLVCKKKTRRPLENVRAQALEDLLNGSEPEFEKESDVIVEAREHQTESDFWASLSETDILQELHYQDLEMNLKAWTGRDIRIRRPPRPGQES